MIYADIDNNFLVLHADEESNEYKKYVDKYEKSFGISYYNDDCPESYLLLSFLAKQGFTPVSETFFYKQN